MATALGFFILGLLLLALGGDSIIQGASGLAQKLGLSPFASHAYATVRLQPTIPSAYTSVPRSCRPMPGARKAWRCSFRSST